MRRLRLADGGLRCANPPYVFPRDSPAPGHLILFGARLQARHQFRAVLSRAGDAGVAAQYQFAVAFVQRLDAAYPIQLHRRAPVAALEARAEVFDQAGQRLPHQPIAVGRVQDDVIIGRLYPLYLSVSYTHLTLPTILLV